MDGFRIVSCLQNHSKKLAVVGLGYVGLPLAVAFGEQFSVIGFDLNQDKIHAYRSGLDPTNEVGEAGIRSSSIFFTADPAFLREASFLIVAVPTPIREDKTPDLTPVLSASRLIGENLSSGSIVVFESTVYPGVTQEHCVPEIEKTSGLQCGKDFFIGYSPERINPGDRVHTLRNITKVVSGMNEAVCNEISEVYGTIINGKTGGQIYRAPSIRVAEAAKLAENTQRDVNIALMNEFSMAFHHMGISTIEVLKAMNTKWNALGFYPGFVGGHCIGVDPYYFIQEAEHKGYHSSLVSTGRQINDGMARFVAGEIIRNLLIHGKTTQADWKIYLMGATFKGNCPDLRNSKSEDLKKLLEHCGLQVGIVDPVASPADIARQFHAEPMDMETITDADCLIFAVDHNKFRSLTPTGILGMFAPEGARVLIDIRNQFKRSEMESIGIHYWSL